MRPIIRRLSMKSFEQFLRVEAASGVVLLGAAGVALLWANSPFGNSYHRLWTFPLSIGAGSAVFSQPLQFWINDGLMAFFFLLAGLEIRRELHDGTLADRSRAMLPLAAALGGVVVPALLYLACNAQSELARGWAVPTATDIAFAVGVLALLGRRVPSSMRVLLLAIAIVDDVVAILIVAIFYSHGLEFGGLGLAALATAALAGWQKVCAAPLWARVVLGGVVWIGLLASGVHPALSGVIVGLLTPPAEAHRAERVLHPWIAFGVMPLFALANAGVTLADVPFAPGITLPLAGGIVVGLVIGKPLGILLAAALTVRLGWCTLPGDIDLKRIGVIGCLAGIGFTMSIFISQLAFEDAVWLNTAKLAILIGSAAAAILGLLAGRRVLKATEGP
jgi:NhaA family Na+:H+ antiporter